MNQQEIAALAELCKLEFNDQALEAFSEEFGAILAFVNQLAELETGDTDAYVSSLHAPLRTDSAQPGLPHEQVIRNAPETDGEGFLIPRVL
ncbi:MAG: Asp-tRNA(Asn)/Glu-tRNA(Gln) amidotransferase subunit GatC [Clostridia bacterium]|nr:Asp-tRNA(Asn)/Glu-tRNA(Gln) amidotransferase subunit GatC [Clostridia bacterium]MBQ9989124.1 Asp-tRNA(Asn)/Glu-tRNA(Gln) amidotransferase subunit GatC [Clostridia bacterium]